MGVHFTYSFYYIAYIKFYTHKLKHWAAFTILHVGGCFLLALEEAGFTQLRSMSFGLFVFRQLQHVS